MSRRSTSKLKEEVRHVSISSSSSNSSRSRSRSLSSLSRGRSRNRSRSRSGSRHRRRRHHGKLPRKYRRSSSSRSRSKSSVNRSRSQERDDTSSSKAHKSGYLGTNSRDPKMIASRIFIGNLPMTDVSKEDLQAIYGRYGTIIGLTVKPGFGFIQFEREQDAQSAVAGEKGSVLRGCQLDVKMATEGRSKPGQEKPPDNEERPSTNATGPPPGYLPPRAAIPPPPGVPVYRPPIPGHPLPGLPPPGAYFGPPLPAPFARGPLPPPDHFRRFSDRYPLEYPPRVGFLSSPALHPLPHVPSPPGVDCEILVVEAQQRPYAENIKKRLMAAGIVTELNVVVDVDVPIALDEAARRRVLFAIVVTEQNEVHRSITVNILHGVPQEHRNMPLDDAITLVTRSYDKYMLERKERVGSYGSLVSPSAAGASGGGGGPDGDFLPAGPRVQYLLNMLADRRFLTVTELTMVIDYLDDRRRAMSAAAGDRPPLPVRSSSRERSNPRMQPEPTHRMEMPEGPRRSFDLDDRDHDRLLASEMRRQLPLHPESGRPGAEYERDHRPSDRPEYERDRLDVRPTSSAAAAAGANSDRSNLRDRVLSELASREEGMRRFYDGFDDRDRPSIPSGPDMRSRPLAPDGSRINEYERERHLERPDLYDVDRIERSASSVPVQSSSSSGLAPDMSIAKLLSSSINFDSPAVKQALDNLLSGGQNIFKNVSDAPAKASYPGT